MTPPENVGNSFVATPPLNGICLQCGGIVSPWYGFVVDFDAMTVHYYKADNRSLTGTADSRSLAGKKTITVQEVEELRSYSAQAIKENFVNTSPTADVDFMLSLSTHGVVEETETFGPLPSSGSLNAILSQLNSIHF